MKKLIIIPLLFILLSVQGQTGRYPFYRGVTAAAPESDIPAHLLDEDLFAWYTKNDGITKDGSNRVSEWADSLGSGHDMAQATEGKMPTHGANGVLFDGTDDEINTGELTGQLDLPVTVYAILRMPTWTGYDRLMSGYTNLSGLLQQITTTPNIRAYNGSASSESSDLAVNTWGIVIITFNGASSELRVNDNTPITGDFGSTNLGGFALCEDQGSGNMANAEFDLVIVRNAADSEAEKDAAYDYLVTRLP